MDSNLSFTCCVQARVTVLPQLQLPLLPPLLAPVLLLQLHLLVLPLVSLARSAVQRLTPHLRRVL